MHARPINGNAVEILFEPTKSSGVSRKAITDACLTSECKLTVSVFEAQIW